MCTVFVVVVCLFLGGDGFFKYDLSLQGDPAKSWHQEVFWEVNDIDHINH